MAPSEREIDVFEGPYPRAIVVQRALNVAGVFARVVEFPMPCAFDAPFYTPPYGSILVSPREAERARALITDIPSRSEAPNRIGK